MKVGFAITTFFLFALVLFVAPESFAQEKTVSVTTETRWHSNRVNIEYMNKRLSEAAEQYKEYAPIPRVAFYDIGYPKDKAEFGELNGYGLLLISALSQNDTELPLKRVYAVLDGKEIELKQLKQVLSKEENPDSRTVKTFGSYRMDAIYLFPVYLRMQQTEILVDFAQNRNAMKIAGFDGQTPDILKDFPKTKPAEQKSFDDAMQRFMKREYPGFFEVK